MEDKAWFSERIRENLDALYGVALRLTRAPADAEDLVADTVTRAWTAFDTLKERKRFRPWLFRILHNRFISDYRKRSVRPAESRYEEHFGDEGSDDLSSYLAEQPEEFLGWWACPERDCFRQILGEEIQSAIENLPEEYQVTVLLINVEGLTYDETAEVLGIPAGTVRSRMRRGRTLLQKALWTHALEAGINLSGTMAGSES